MDNEWTNKRTSQMEWNKTEMMRGKKEKTKIRFDQIISKATRIYSPKNKHKSDAINFIYDIIYGFRPNCAKTLATSGNHLGLFVCMCFMQLIFCVHIIALFHLPSALSSCFIIRFVFLFSFYFSFIYSISLYTSCFHFWSEFWPSAYGAYMWSMWFWCFQLSGNETVSGAQNGLCILLGVQTSFQIFIFYWGIVGCMPRQQIFYPKKPTYFSSLHSSISCISVFYSFIHCTYKRCDAANKRNKKPWIYSVQCAATCRVYEM